MHLTAVAPELKCVDDAKPVTSISTAPRLAATTRLQSQMTKTPAGTQAEVTTGNPAIWLPSMMKVGPPVTADMPCRLVATDQPVVVVWAP